MNHSHAGFSDTEEQMFSLIILVAASVSSGIGACLIVSATCLLLLCCLSKWHARKSRMYLPSVEGKAKHNYQVAPSAGNTNRKLSGERDVVQNQTDPAGKGFDNRGLPAPPTQNQRPPEAVPRTSVVSVNAQAPPLPVERQSPLINAPGTRRSSGASQQVSGGVGPPTDTYNVAGHGMNGGVARGTPSHQPPAAYMKVVDAQREEGGVKEELYEDVGEREKEEVYEEVDGMSVEGSYLTHDEVNSNFTLNSNDAYTV